MRLYGRQEFLNQANDKVTLNKKLITKEARYILEEKLSLDIEFYEYLLQRLFNQANKSGILPPWKKGFIFILVLKNSTDPEGIQFNEWIKEENSQDIGNDNMIKIPEKLKLTSNNLKYQRFGIFRNPELRYRGVRVCPHPYPPPLTLPQKVSI